MLQIPATWMLDNADAYRKSYGLPPWDNNHGSSRRKPSAQSSSSAAATDNGKGGTTTAPSAVGADSKILLLFIDVTALIPRSSVTQPPPCPSSPTPAHTRISLPLPPHFPHSFLHFFIHTCRICIFFLLHYLS